MLGTGAYRCLSFKFAVNQRLIALRMQSNMDFSVAPWGGGGCLGANETVAAAATGKYNDVRLMHGYGRWFNSSLNAGHDVGSFSAVCYLTALQMKKLPGHADRPIGLIQASVGGTIIEEWMDPAALEICLPASDSKSHANASAQPDYGEHNSDDFYAMIQPLAPMSLTGILWYQGENNMVQNYQAANKSWDFQDYYGCLFKAKVNSWRQLFRSPEMFYGFVSLAAYGSDDSNDTERSADGLPRIRLDQNSVLSLPNTGVALALDLGDNGKIPWTPPSGRHGGIHPRNKTEVARRLVLAYAKASLGLNVIASGPVFAAATAVTAANVVTLSFTNTDGGVVLSPTAQCKPTPCCPPAGVPRHKNNDQGVPFEVLVDGVYVLPAKTTITMDGKSVQLALPAGVKATGVRYCQQGYPMCVLRNGAGLPAMPFVANITGIVDPALSRQQAAMKLDDGVALVCSLAWLPTRLGCIGVAPRVDDLP